MLLLTSTTGQLQLVTGAAASIDVHTTWVDTDNTAITPGRQNSHVAAAATTVIVPSPPASTQRNIKTAHVRNKDTVLSSLVTVQIFDGTSTFVIYSVTLNFGDMLELTDFAGFNVITRSY
jgi:hypothetical protein